jgi:hypothetical protein
MVVAPETKVQITAPIVMRKGKGAATGFSTFNNQRDIFQFYQY